MMALDDDINSDDEEWYEDTGDNFELDDGDCDSDGDGGFQLSGKAADPFDTLDDGDEE